MKIDLKYIIPNDITVKSKIYPEISEICKIKLLQT